jgi:hypothetical protein
MVTLNLLNYEHIVNLQICAMSQQNVFLLHVATLKDKCKQLICSQQLKEIFEITRGTTGSPMQSCEHKNNITCAVHIILFLIKSKLIRQAKHLAQRGTL